MRLLTNYNMDAENRLCLLLLGPPELRRRLTMAVYEAPAQRIVVRHHMGPHTREELPAYLTHRLRLAGTELPLFEHAAEKALYQATAGLPRKVNGLAQHALMAPHWPGPRSSRRSRGGRPPRSGLSRRAPRQRRGTAPPPYLPALGHPDGSNRKTD